MWGLHTALLKGLYISSKGSTCNLHAVLLRGLWGLHTVPVRRTAGAVNAPLVGHACSSKCTAGTVQCFSKGDSCSSSEDAMHNSSKGDPNSCSKKTV